METQRFWGSRLPQLCIYIRRGCTRVYVRRECASETVARLYLGRVFSISTRFVGFSQFRCYPIRITAIRHILNSVVQNRVVSNPVFKTSYIFVHKYSTVNSNLLLNIFVHISTQTNKSRTNTVCPSTLADSF